MVVCNAVSRAVNFRFICNVSPADERLSLICLSIIPIQMHYDSFCVSAVNAKRLLICLSVMLAPESKICFLLCMSSRKATSLNLLSQSVRGPVYLQCLS